MGGDTLTPVASTISPRIEASHTDERPVTGHRTERTTVRTPTTGFSGSEPSLSLVCGGSGVSEPAAVSRYQAEISSFLRTAEVHLRRAEDASLSPQARARHLGHARDAYNHAVASFRSYELARNPHGTRGPSAVARLPMWEAMPTRMYAVGRQIHSEDPRAYRRMGELTLDDSPSSSGFHLEDAPIPSTRRPSHSTRAAGRPHTTTCRPPEPITPSMISGEVVMAAHALLEVNTRLDQGLALTAPQIQRAEAALSRAEGSLRRLEEMSPGDSAIPVLRDRIARAHEGVEAARSLTLRPTRTR